MADANFIDAKFNIGSSIKYVHSDSIKYVRSHMLADYIPPPSTTIPIWLLKDDVNEIYCDFLTIKEPQTIK